MRRVALVTVLAVLAPAVLVAFPLEPNEAPVADAAMAGDLDTLRTRIDTYLAGQRRQPRSLVPDHGS